jgi:predicted nucleic acid-binding protein
MKILVDTSVWSLALRRPKTVALNAVQMKTVSTLGDLVRDGRAVLTGAIRQELLSGIKLEAQFETLRSALTAFEDVAPAMQDYELAAQLFNTCRSKGIQGSNTDFLICAISKNHRLPILSLDNDFANYQKHLPIQLFVN